MKRDQIEHLLRRRPSAAVIASVIFAIAAVIYGVAMMAKANAVAESIKEEKAQLVKARGDLATAMAEISTLKSALDKASGDAKTAGELNQTRTAELESKVAAFAKQAAVCDTVRQKLGRKG